jgi:O-antigen ligase
LALLGVCLAAGLGVGIAAVLVNALILLAVIPLLAVGVWAVRSDERALGLLLLVIAVLPRFAAPVKFGLTPTFLDLALIALALAWLFRTSQHPLAVRDVPITLPLIGLIGVAVVTFIIGIPNGALTPLVLRRFVELVLSLAFVFVLVAILRDRTALERTMRLFFVLSALAALIGLLLYVLPDGLVIRLLSALRPFGYPSGPDVLRFINDDPALMQRATGLWIDPNVYGGFLLIAGAALLPQVFTRQPLLPRWAVLGGLGAIGLALVLTVSRGAMLGLLCVALALGVLRYRRLLLLVLLVVALAFILPQTRDLIAHFAAGFAGQDLSTQMRLGEYKDALRLIERYPLLGVGFADTPDVDLYIGVSSMYLLIAQQMGLLGVSAFFITMGTLFVSAWRARRSVWPDERLSAIWLGAYAAVTGALISGIFDHYFFNIDFHNSVMLLWVMVSIAIGSQMAARTAHATDDVHAA